MIYVVAGTARQFREYCNEMKLKPGNDAIYVADIRTLLGRNEGTFVFVGTFNLRPDLNELLERIQVIEAFQK